MWRTFDKIWEYMIKSSAGWRCELCGDANNGLDAHHVILRRHLWTRWDKRNGVAVCQGGCHDPVKVLAWLKRTDRRRYNWIMAQKRKVHHGERIDFAKIERCLTTNI